MKKEVRIIKILFWNIYNKNLISPLIDLIKENQLDIVSLAEAENLDITAILNNLKLSGNEWNNIQISPQNDIRVLAKKEIKIIPYKEDGHYSIYKIKKYDKVDVEVKNENKILKNSIKDVVEIKQRNYIGVEMGSEKLKHRPVIVGSGPAGLFAALVLAQRGFNPIMLERGLDVDNRTNDINDFWNNRKFKNNSNVQFGEGGAGTFSDGKLTTRIKDIRCRKVLDELVNFGSPEEILYSHKPHVGTDILKNVVKNIRNEIIRLGGEVRFDTLVTDIITENGSIKGVVVNNNETIESEVVILAIGHSARDTYKMLYNRGVTIIQKPFAIGARIEHPQELINKSQYKEFYNHPRLGAADYRLIEHTSNLRTAYTFCMCPGGSVIASASNEFEVVTNGMSEHARDKVNANSAFLVNVIPSDFGSEDPLAGVYFQEKYERLAYELGGKNYNAPVQLVGDFLNDKVSISLGNVEPSYKPGYTFVDLRECLPEFVTSTMKEALQKLDNKLKGFAMHDAVLTGVETRSSAPIRIVRDEETLESVSLEKLYPCGEGAGYAGGIVTAAVDGIKCAEKIIENYSKIQ